MAPDDLNLPAALARLEGVVTTEIRHLAQDIKTITQKLDAYATQKELQATNQRLVRLEETKDSIVKWVFGAWLSGLGLAATMGWKKLFP